MLLNLTKNFSFSVFQILKCLEKNEPFFSSLYNCADKKIHQKYLSLLLALANAEVDNKKLFQIISPQNEQTDPYELNHYGLLIAEMEDISLLTQYVDLLSALRKGNANFDEQIKGLLQQIGFSYTNRRSRLQKCCSKGPKKFTLIERIKAYSKKEKDSTELLINRIQSLSQERVTLAVRKKIPSPSSLSKNEVFLDDEQKIADLVALVENPSLENYQSAISCINAYPKEFLQQLYPFFAVQDLNGLTVKLLTLFLLGYSDLSPNTAAIAEEVVAKSAAHTELLASKKFAEMILKEAKDRPISQENLLPKKQKSEEKISAPFLLGEFCTHIALSENLGKVDKEASEKDRKYREDYQKKSSDKKRAGFI